jgi:SAM-dependent methyltransferase
MLGDIPLAGLRTLDVGCGLGFFSQRLHQRGAIVTACDIGPRLVQRTRERVGCEAVVADALALEAQFGPNSFDVVVSSECIEHTPDPLAAVQQMAAVLRPAGWLALSTPNQVWKPIVALATATRLRAFDGNENFSTWRGLTRVLDSCGIDILQRSGLHLFPFQLRLHGLSRWCDARLQGLRRMMINICLLGRKRET